jgi:lipopolysaccharide export system protein LptC
MVSGVFLAVFGIAVPRPGHIWERLWGAKEANIAVGTARFWFGRMGSGMNSLTAVSDSDQSGPRVFARFGRADSDRVFRAAVRHSRYVRILRVAVPVAVVVALAGGVAFSVLLKPLRVLSGVPVDLGSLVVSGTKIMMQQPRLAGFTRDNRRYDMVARAAAQDLTKPDMVELHGVHATMEMKDNVTFETTAKDGLYNAKTEQLTLSQDIVVTSSSGYQAFLNEAVLDVKAGKIVSDKPVEVKTASWTINANRMEVTESGDLMRFERGVSVTLLLDSATTGAGGEARKP